MSFVNRFSRIDKAKLFHSSGHAQLSRGDKQGSSAIGKKASQVQPDNQSRIVGSYKQSRLVVRDRFSSYSRRVAQGNQVKQGMPSKSERVRGESAQGSRQAFNAGQGRQGTKPLGFQEPTGRNYNPFS